jgi:predicted NAD/FAD-binding protein
MLGDPSPEEHRLLSAWHYQRNLALLHSDPTFMPRRQKAWASWNYRREAAGAGGEGLSVTYDMNRLQGLQTSRPYFVTLNPRKPPADHTLVASVDFTHPVYTFQSLESQKGLPLLNGIRNTFFCGSYFRHGFHEDAVQSALAVGKALGVEL